MATANLSSICWLACPTRIRIRTAFELILIKPHSAFNLFVLKCHISFLHTEKQITQSVLFGLLWDVQSLSNTLYCVTLHTLKSLRSFSVIFCCGPSVYCPASQHSLIKRLLNLNMMWLWVFQKVFQHWWFPSFLMHRFFIRRFVSRHQRWTGLRVFAFTRMVEGS